MQFIDILRKDIKELDANEIGITYEFDTPLVVLRDRVN